MELAVWLVYLGVISVLIASPGPSALLCMSEGLKHGYRKSSLAVFGGAVAALLLMTVSAVGLGAIFLASELLFTVTRLLGACYLWYLAWQSFFSNKINPKSQLKATSSKAGSAGLFRKGFMVGISNPKDIVFFIALFPGFVNQDLPQTGQYAVLAGTWFVMDCLLMSIYAAVGARIANWLGDPAHMCLLNRLVGVIFFVIGAALFAAVWQGA